MKPPELSRHGLRPIAVLVFGTCILWPTPSALGRATEPRPTTPAEEEAVPEGLSTGDWAGIRAAYEAGRHAAYAVEDGYEARNPGQGWRMHFDGRGFLTQPLLGAGRGDWSSSVTASRGAKRR